MEAVQRLPARGIRIPLFGRVQFDPAGFSAWLLPIILILYLALNDGGYGPIERGEAGIALWWLILVGTLVGALPSAGGSRAGRALLIVLALFAGYTALSLGWTESAERTSVELARVALYLGVFVLALAIQGEGRWRHLLDGVTCGVVLVCALAVLSRLEPNLFPERVSGEFLESEIVRRLAYPFNYSSAVGVMAALALPLALGASARARSLVGQALAAAALPVLALTLWLTSSGLAHIAAAIGLLLFFALAPDRLPKLITALVATIGSAILFAALADRAAIDQGLTNNLALQQGDEMLAILLVVSAGVGLVHAGVGVALRYGRRPSWTRVPRRAALIATAAVVSLLVVGGVAAGAPGEISDQWDQFRTREGSLTLTENRSSEIFDTSSSGRYEFWRSAVDANATAPLVGTGPGTYEFWWSREGTHPQFIRDAHSLFMETLAELGVIGVVLIAAFTIGVLGFGAVRLWHAPPELRLALATAVAAGGVFIAAAAVDWVWELSALPVVFFMLAAIAVAAGSDARVPGRSSKPARERLWKLGIAVLSLAALAAIALPLAGAKNVEASQAAASEGEVGLALERARDAIAAEPYAATPRLQEALLLEQQGDLPGAAQAAREATQRERTNWRTWLVLSRLEARNGNAQAATDAYRHVEALNPKSVLLAQLREAIR
jgi:O-antigen ligase